MVQIGKALIDPIRDIAFGAITNAFVALGTSIASPARMVIFKNSTNAIMEISLNGTNIHGRFPPGIASWSLASSSITGKDYVLPKGTQFYIRYLTVPGSGNFWIELGRAATV